MTGTCCLACGFLNHQDATASNAPDALVKVYYPARMTGTRCPACDFLNHQDATASDAPDALVQCNACTRVYYPAALADDADEAKRAVRLLESSRVIWRRDWDAMVLGAVIGFMADALAEWLF